MKEIDADVKQLNAFKTKAMEDAEEVAVVGFPRSVNKLNSLIEHSSFSYDRLPQLREDLKLPEITPEQAELIMNGGDNNSVGPQAKRAKLKEDVSAPELNKIFGFASGPVPCNKHVAELVDAVKPLLRNAVEEFNKVKLWILFLIPRIEDGNNFGVSIQEEALSEVRTVESEAASFLDQLSRYFLSRAKLVTRIARYPHVDDYRRALYDMDEKQFINLRLVIIEMRNHYATLHDLIMKNLEKIKKPRNSNMDAMY